MRFSYLAAPYTHSDPKVMEARFLATTKKAAALMLDGEVIFSPLSHSHPISEHMPDGKAVDGAFWKAQDAPYIELCDKLIVYMLAGWEKSPGIAHEIEVAKKRGIPVEYVA